VKTVATLVCVGLAVGLLMTGTVVIFVNSWLLGLVFLAVLAVGAGAGVSLGYLLER
jgi:hypothetical protein